MDWNMPEALGSGLQFGKLSAVSWALGRMDVFGVGAGGKLLHWYYDSGAVNLADQQEPLDSQSPQSGVVSAVSWASGRLDVFGIGTDGKLLHSWYDAEAGATDFVSQHESLDFDGKLDPNSLSAVSWGAGRLDVFGINLSNGTLLHWYYDAGAGATDFVSQHESLGGLAPSAPSAISAASWASGRLDVFGVDAGGELLHWYYDAGAGATDFVSQHESLGGALNGLYAVSAVSWGAGRLDVFGIGDNPGRSLLHWWYDNGAGNFSTQQPETLGIAGELGGYNDLSLVSRGANRQDRTNRLDLFADSFGAREPIAYWLYDSGTGNLYAQPEFLPFGQFSGVSGICAVSFAPGRLDIFGIGTDGTLLHWWNS